MTTLMYWIIGLGLVVGSAAVGFVRREGRNFMLDGRPFYYAGANSYDTFTKSPAQIDQRMANLYEDGVRVVRVTGFNHFDWHGFEPKKGEYREEQFQLFDYIMKSAGDHNIRVIIMLENYWDAYGGIDARLKWEGLPSGTHKARTVFYTHAGCQEGYRNYLKHFVTRNNTVTGKPYSQDPYIFSWELMNEPRYQDGGEDTTGVTLRKWVDSTGALIKSLDPNHMISIGLEGHGKKYNYGYDEGNPFVYIHLSPVVDFCTGHAYPQNFGMNFTEAAKLVLNWVNDAHFLVGKPFVLEEYNTMSLKDEYWKAMLGVIELTNAAGDNFWNYLDYNDRRGDFDIWHGHPILTSAFKPHADIMNSKT